MRKVSIKDSSRSSSFYKPADGIRQKQTSTTLQKSDSKADAWEKAQIAKIRKR